MRMKLFLAAGAIALGGFVAATAGAARGGIAYAFVGKLTAAPSGGHVSISVERGTPAALRTMLGHSVEQTFSYGDKTEFLQWAGGVPKVVEADDLDAGDYVRVNVRAPRGSSLDTIEGTPAFLIGDHGTELVKPDKPDYLFRGQVASVGTASLTLTVRGGNMRALRLMRGQSTTQTFTVGKLDDLPALGGQGAVGDLVLRPEGRGPRCDPRSHRGALDARPGRGDRGRQGRRARARTAGTVLRPVARPHCRDSPEACPCFSVLRRLYATVVGFGNHVTMSRRRFLLLAATLVALNTFFWLAQGGFALPGALIDRFFGPRMIRAEVIVGGPLQVNDFRLDRGVITTTAPGSITIRERDGTVVTISVSPETKVIAGPRVRDVSQLRPPMRVLVVRKANAPAAQIQVEGRLAG